MAVQQFCLRWNNHQPNFISVFTSLLTNESLVDVTLAAEGKQLQAHKVVLSACSTYFQSLFAANPCQHPIVILKDIKYSDLKTMVDFMYYGEVNVSQDQLPAILKTAETLKVKGLAEMPEQLSLSKSVSQSSDGKCESQSPISPSVLRRKRLRKSSTGSGSEQTSEETAASGSGSTELVPPSPLKPETDESSLRREASSESETREGSHSFEEENYPPRNVSEEGESTTIRWSSSEERPSTSSQPPPQVVEPIVTPSMGSKRGRLLMRQHRIKKDSDMSQAESESDCIKIERQSSEPSPNLLSVPQHSYLTKQNSSPHLSSTSSTSVQQTVQAVQQQQGSTTGGGSNNHSQVGASSQVTCLQTAHSLPTAPSLDSSTASTSSSTAHPTVRTKALEELRRAASTPQCSNKTSGNEPCEGSRACHCPVLRPGPALGCNFCWNTIDTHGRILRRKTKYHCPECQTNLCIVPCFQEYHERQCGLISNLSSGTTRESGSGGSSSSCTRGNSPQPSFPTIMKTSSL
ncbi:hypothetical protein O3M35_002693 [Rhynocoris fuscipes]|uniref:BTB domain-containing protein n=1 Tax=Rhynocoris fuscipes TaxID=488301 RepID=A0AAW1CQA2_9HEMI